MIMVAVTLFMVGVIVVTVTFFFLFCKDRRIYFQQGHIIVLTNLEPAFYHKAMILPFLIRKFKGLNGFFFHYFRNVFFSHNDPPCFMNNKTTRFLLIISILFLPVLFSQTE